MAWTQCWAAEADGQRCGQPSTFGSYFCIRHGEDGGPEPAAIWRAPVCEMPPGLVVLIRANDPDVVFPASDPDPFPQEPEDDFVLGLALPPLHPAPADWPDPAPPAPPSLPNDPAPLAWLLHTLQTAIEGVMADDAATPLQKANAVSRLGNLYLKTHRAAELTRENKALSRRIAELEAELVTATAVAARLEALTAASPRPADDRTPAAAETSRDPEGHPASRAQRRTSTGSHPLERGAIPHDSPRPAARQSDLRSGWHDPP